METVMSEPGQILINPIACDLYDWLCDKSTPLYVFPAWSPASAYLPVAVVWDSETIEMSFFGMTTQVKSANIELVGGVIAYTAEGLQSLRESQLGGALITWFSVHKNHLYPISELGNREFLALDDDFEQGGKK